MDTLLAKLFGADVDLMNQWITPGKYVSGQELVEAGLAEMIDLEQLVAHQPATPGGVPAKNGSASASRKAKQAS